jgi:hypothetical protein
LKLLLPLKLLLLLPQKPLLLPPLTLLPAPLLALLTLLLALPTQWPVLLTLLPTLPRLPLTLPRLLLTPLLLPSNACATWDRLAGSMSGTKAPVLWIGAFFYARCTGAVNPRAGRGMKKATAGGGFWGLAW